MTLYYHTPNFAGNGIHLSKITREGIKLRKLSETKNYVSPFARSRLCAIYSVAFVFTNHRKNTGGKSWL